MTLSPGTRLGPYEIEGVLGRGGMGEVYRARDTRLGREVAVKILPAALAADPESVRRFEKEARAVASLSHPHVVPLFDVGEHEGMRYAVTELVSGETLRSRLAQGALPVREAAEIAAQIGEGLAAAHDRGVVHRDVKPENVILTASGFARILDFGLAKRSGPGIGVEAGEDEPTRSELLTEPGVVAGTVGYMSPEQVRGDAVDGRSDVFSLGVVLWEMLTGRRPFSGDSHVETLNAILKEEPQPELALEGLPPELSRIVRRCLDKRKEDRYHSAADLAHDLRSAIREPPRSPTHAAAVPPARPAPKRLTAILLAVAFLVLAIAAVVVSRIGRAGSRAPSTNLPRTLAVLPFRAISAEGMPAHFGLGLADSLIGHLATLRELTVRPTSAIARYETAVQDATEVGRQLGVEAVLEGTYQKLEGMTRVSVQMTDVSRGGILWSERIDLPQGKLFELEDAISRHVAEKLQLELVPSLRRTIGPEGKVPDRVLEEYLASRARLSRVASSDASMRQELAASFDSILSKQPDFAAAIGARAYTRAWLTFLRPSVEGYRAVLSDCERAISLDPDLVEPRVAKASVAWSALGGWDVVTAVRELKMALSKSPGLDIAYFDLARIYVHNGWLPEFEAAIRAGEAINPSGAEADRQRATRAFWLGGDPRKTLDRYERLPAEIQGIWAVRWPKDLLRGQIEEPRSVEPHIRSELVKAPDDLKPAYSAIVAILLARQGKDFSDVESEILAADTRMGHFHHVFHNLAEAHALKREPAAAAQMLERAGETGMPCAECFDSDPFLASIRSSPEYARVRREMEHRTAGYRAALKDIL